MLRGLSGTAAVLGLTIAGTLAVAGGPVVDLHRASVQGGDAEWGAYLASACTTCHRRDGSDDGIPAITGWPEAGFAAALHAYRAGQRPNPTMQTIARGLDDAEIAALAAYFATYPPAAD